MSKKPSLRPLEIDCSSTFFWDESIQACEILAPIYMLSRTNFHQLTEGPVRKTRNVRGISSLHSALKIFWESKEELKSLLVNESENEKTGLKLNIQKMKIMASSHITSWQIDGETMETVRNFIFLDSQILQRLTAVMILKDTCSLEEKQ